MKFSNAVEIKPYIGEKYHTTSPKLFILGESAYGDHEGDKDLLVNAITDIKDGRDTDYTQYPQTKMFFTKVFNLFNGESNWDNQASFWDDVCFYDYVQKILDEPKQKISLEHYENAEDPFFDVLKKVEPDIVIVLGIEFYKKLPTSDGEPGKTIKIRGIENEFIETWKYNINRKIVYVGRVQHPSSFGYKKDVWVKLLSKFLKEYKKGNLNG